MLSFEYTGQHPQAPIDRDSMWKYQDVLPVCETSKIVSLSEGGTPLQSARPNRDLNLFFKCESANPTGSHKDRAVSIGITKAVEFGFDTCMLYSDGSAALSSAAYAAKAGIRNIALVPEGVPDYRVIPLLAYGSTIVEYAGTSADALDWVHEVCAQLGIYETTTYQLANPYEAEGPKTIAYEIVEQLGRAPDWMAVPVGGGGTLAGIWRGFCDLERTNKIDKLPRMIGAIPPAFDVLQRGLDLGVSTDADLRLLCDSDAPNTMQVKIAMAFPPDGVEAIAAIRDSRGFFVNVPDQNAISSLKKLASEEGIYVEISAASSLAAIEALYGRNDLEAGDTVVVLLSGSGFRETGALAGVLPGNRLRLNRAIGKEALQRALNR